MSASTASSSSSTSSASMAEAQRPEAVTYKPPQPGVKPHVLGQSAGGAFATVRVIGREAEVSSAVTPTAWMSDRGEARAKLTVALAAPQRPAPGLPVRVPGLEATKPEGKQFWHPPVKGPLYVADGRYGPYITTDAQDPSVRQGFRAALISLPGELDFAPPRQDPKVPAMTVLLQGHEALRNQEGAYLSKAIVAYPVDAAGNPEPCGLEALRTFLTKPDRPDHKPLPIATPKYNIEVSAGRLSVTQWDGQASVRAGRLLKTQV